MSSPETPVIPPLPRARELAAGTSDSEAARSAPPLPGPATLSEVFGSARDGAAIAFTLAQLPAGGAVLWVQDRMSVLETGRPYGPGLADYGRAPEELILACGRGAADVLWTMEEGLACDTLTAVIGEVWGDPCELSFTATKRLVRRAERSGVHACLVRWNGRAGLSAARRRWRVAALPSQPHPWDARAPGLPRWQVELFRAQGRAPGTWEARYEPAAHRLHLDAPFRDGALDPAAERGGDVVPLRRAG